MKRLLFWAMLIGAVALLLRRLGVLAPQGHGHDGQAGHVMPPGSGLSAPPQPDSAHAPGHSHMGPPPRVPDLESIRRWADNQPWIRRSHTDSQQRRYRR